MIPFDTNLVRDLDRHAGAILRGVAANDGPAFDIVRKGEEAYEVVLAVPGYDLSELSVTSQEGVLKIEGQPAGAEGEASVYLQRGIARRPFAHRFRLAPHVEVVDAGLAHGLLRVLLERRVPEHLKPRSIAINQAKAA